MNISVNVQDYLCETCIYDKAHRLSFECTDNCSGNVCGPFDNSFRKAQYFVLFKDQLTKLCCVFFLRQNLMFRQKSDVANAVKDFLAFGRKLGHNAKEIISYNG